MTGRAHCQRQVAFLYYFRRGNTNRSSTVNDSMSTNTYGTSAWGTSSKGEEGLAEKLQCFVFSRVIKMHQTVGLAWPERGI